MSEYWKSQPRKFCEYCKCWLADNKPSIQAHEFGTRHKNNVIAKIQEVQKKGQKDYEENKRLEHDFKRMERNAALAYEKDLERLHNERVSKLRDEETTLRQEIDEEDAEIARQEARVEEITEQLAESKSEWFEAKTEEGYSYFWNVKTKKTVWVAPEEGYVSLEEQESILIEENAGGESGDAPETEPKEEIAEQEDKVKIAMGPPVKKSASEFAKKPAPKPVKPLPAISPAQYWNARVDDAYGSGGWKPAEAEEPTPKQKKTADLQLPQFEKPQLQVPTIHRQPGIKFREKTASCSQGSALEAFKKRKMDTERQKYLRKRPGDE